MGDFVLSLEELQGLGVSKDSEFFDTINIKKLFLVHILWETAPYHVYSNFFTNCQNKILIGNWIKSLRIFYSQYIPNFIIRGICTNLIDLSEIREL